MNSLLLVIILSASPIAEARLGIPIAMGLGFDAITAFLIGVGANIAVVPFIFIFLGYIHTRLIKISVNDRIFNYYVLRTRKGLEAKITKRGEFLALFLLVALPIPGTGAYAGVLAAFLFGLKKRKAIPTISLGVFVSGIIVTLVSTGIISLLPAPA